MISAALVLGRLALGIGPGGSYLFGMIWKNPQILLLQNISGTNMPGPFALFLWDPGRIGIEDR